MTKAELIDKVAEAAAISRGEAEIVVKTVLDSIVEALHGGDKVELRGFGSFRLRSRRPRIGRNPKTGERVEVPAKSVPYFKPGKELREMLNPQDHAGESTDQPFGTPRDTLAGHGGLPESD
ncbi:MAG: integration host factor subunit beta [Acidobacteriota bacterium]|nr:MAG: integration host factor subunit beta [Acidobacteriota bacterium]